MAAESRTSCICLAFPKHYSVETYHRFLWRYHPPRNGEPQGSLEVYKWTGRNDYVALCEPEFISFGGG
ncbi:hypothetical protein PAXRUDRAFT_830288 [Paxillus rubicundulus Ve08.2h10]|uniref:Uncharacterized protein n=1 Tax=Paxillus rubicundulus Ve08.2h10 TaxID=930991 RepID=A0A0D0DZ26_9AGAM|nr:hypothetical protein PAXRUDRAFT_830288 [Paxillus rubicundulus Ve08.2h10]